MDMRLGWFGAALAGALGLVTLTGCTDYELRANVVIDRFEQVGRNTVDVLVVVDNSCSMAEEQGKLGSNFPSFIEAFVESDVDYQVANITTDMMDPTHQGVLHEGVFWDCVDPSDPASCEMRLDPDGDPIPTGTRIITRETENAADVFLGNTKLGTTGSGFEMGLDAARYGLCRALDPRDEAAAETIAERCPELWQEYEDSGDLDGIFTNRGFLRDEAKLSVIFVSDEDDMSPDPVADYLVAYVGSKGDRAYRDNDLLNVSAVVGDAPNGCPPGDEPIAEAGLRYLDLAARTGGAQDSICNDDFTPIVRELGLVISGLNNRFPLTRLPRLSTLTMEIRRMSDGRDVDPASFVWVYDDLDNSIVFNPSTVPQPGHEVIIRYQVSPTVSGVNE
jgi:hypothetical protein